jgi:hypothetical protein
MTTDKLGPKIKFALENFRKYTMASRTSLLVLLGAA